MSTKETSPNLSTYSVSISKVRIDHQYEALGIGEDYPRLSWTIETNQQEWQQAAYEIAAITADGTVRGQTGQISSDRSVMVDWPFTPLVSRERILVRVRVWGPDGQPSEWSEPVPVETGLLKSQDWVGKFIAADWEDPDRQKPAPIFRREFNIRSGVKLARLYITALGVYEAQLNGIVVGDQVMAPGWTSYHHRLRYQTFDVTQMLIEGKNAIGVMLGDGWFRGRLSWHSERQNVYGERLALLAQLEVTYQDGTTEKLITDENWSVAPGPILRSDIYDGEKYDARLARPGWSRAGHQSDGWAKAQPVEWNISTLVAPSGPPVRRIESISPVAILSSSSGNRILDFGQNLVGRLCLTVRGPKGHTITLRHAEVLEKGELCIRPLRSAAALDQYTLRGDGVETWEPRFTFHGFRYAEVENWPGELGSGDIYAIVCHSDMVRTGWFECSHPLVNRLHENVIWSMRGNFLDVPTDCPQRDERLGWTGDIQVFAPTAAFLFDCAGFLNSWLTDLAVEQKDAGGIVPLFVPFILNEKPIGVAAWSDAAVIVPWVLYQRFGDRKILATQYESMRSWVDKITEIAGNDRVWKGGYQLGDWLDPAAPPDRPADALTDKDLIATAYYARSAELVGRAAGVLGLIEEENQYLALAGEIRQAFSREYVTPVGKLTSDTQTAYALAIEFELLTDPEERRLAGERLVNLVRANGYYIGTGFVGTPLICDALCDLGHIDDAYLLILQHDCPSWLYPVKMGATTIWERWDSMLPDGSINPGEMTSFNHYALGAVADWLHRIVGGLAPAEPGYKKILFRPQPGGGITRASAQHLTPYGLAECVWEYHGGKMNVMVTVPPNTTGMVSLPGRESEFGSIGSGVHSWSYHYSASGLE